MEYIDKESREGEDLVADFLDRAKKYGEPYPTDLYDAFDKKATLKRILLEEQNDRCCYCMRRINNDRKTTLEHLIINNASSKEVFDQYLENETVLNEKVCYANEFVEAQATAYPPYPHTIAYQKLAASCDGKIENNTVVCCNLKRGNTFIEPLVLYPNIRERASYKRNGYILLNGDTDPSMVTILGLNNDTLRIIRAILIYAKENGIDIATCRRDDLTNGAISRVDIDEDEDKLVFNFKKDVFWNLLKDYDYFLQNPNIAP